MFLIPGYLPRPHRLSDACRRSLSASARTFFEREYRRLSTRGGRAEAQVFQISDDGGSGSGSGLDARSIRAGRGLATSSSVFRDVTTASGLVPDGVAAVSVTAKGRTVTATPAENFFVAQLPVRTMFGDHFTVTWLDAAGRPMKTIASL